MQPNWMLFDECLKTAQELMKLFYWRSGIDLYQSDSNPDNWCYGDFQDLLKTNELGFHYAGYVMKDGSYLLKEKKLQAF